jgi:predicted Rossmann-fold nucleotide-binding protein
MEELIEVLTWTQLGLHGKPCGLLNVDGYWDPLIAMFDRAVADGFLTPEGRALLLVAVEPDELIERLEQFVPPPVQRRRER